MTHCTENCYERGCFSTLPPACTCPHADRDCRDRAKKTSEEVWDEAVRCIQPLPDMYKTDKHLHERMLWDKVNEIISKLNDTKIRNLSNN